MPLFPGKFSAPTHLPAARSNLRPRDTEGIHLSRETDLPFESSLRSVATRPGTLWFVVVEIWTAFVGIAVLSLRPRIQPGGSAAFFQDGHTANPLGPLADPRIGTEAADTTIAFAIFINAPLSGGAGRTGKMCALPVLLFLWGQGRDWPVDPANPDLIPGNSNGRHHDGLGIRRTLQGGQSRRWGSHGKSQLRNAGDRPARPRFDSARRACERSAAHACARSPG